MAKMIPATERITRARVLIRQAYDLPVPEVTGRFDFSYIARVKALLQQARDLVKFIPNTPTATDALNAEVAKIFLEAEKANQAILHPDS